MEIAQIICSKFEIPEENLVFDLSKPVGQLRKPAITNAPDDFEFTDLNDGIEKTINWFEENYKNIRK